MHQRSPQTAWARRQRLFLFCPSETAPAIPSTLPHSISESGGARPSEAVAILDGTDPLQMIDSTPDGLPWRNPPDS